MELTKYQKCPVPEVAEYGVKSGMDHLELVFGCSREISGINTFSNKKTFFSKHSFLSINFSKKNRTVFFSYITFSLGFLSHVYLFLLLAVFTQEYRLSENKLILMPFLGKIKVLQENRF